MTLADWQELLIAASNVVAGAPTGWPEDGDCGSCHHGIINIGTPLDPEPGPCPRCNCELHQERHEDCMAVLSRAIKKVKL